ncbi:hypothetical protein C8J38_101906 [Rhizobium sp. PP-WC-2G-219]|nr:hypothetical protein C8J38_101906 [Rhizobium sp. PP-WC-2G-219]
MEKLSCSVVKRADRASKRFRIPAVFFMPGFCMRAGPDRSAAHAGTVPLRTAIRNNLGKRNSTCPSASGGYSARMRSR